MDAIKLLHARVPQSEAADLVQSRAHLPSAQIHVLQDFKAAGAHRAVFVSYQNHSGHGDLDGAPRREAATQQNADCSAIDADAPPNPLKRQTLAPSARTRSIDQ